MAATGWGQSTFAEQAWGHSRSAALRWAIAGGVVGLGIAIVAFAPAAWLAGWVSNATDQRLLLADARGSVWSGNAVVVLTGGPGSRDASALPGRIEWSAGLRGVGLELRAAQACCLNGNVGLLVKPGFGRITVTLLAPNVAGIAGGRGGNSAGRTAGPVNDTTGGNTGNTGNTGTTVGGVDNARGTAPGDPTVTIGQWPAAWLAGLGTPWNTLQLGGALRLSSPGLTVESAQGRWRLDGRADVELLGAASRVSTLAPLGDYRLTLSGDAASAGVSTLALTTLGGVLQLGGNGSWAAGGLRFRGDARAAPGAEAALNNLLNIIGRRDGARSVISIG